MTPVTSSSGSDLLPEYKSGVAPCSGGRASGNPIFVLTIPTAISVSPISALIVLTGCVFRRSRRQRLEVSPSLYTPFPLHLSLYHYIYYCRSSHPYPHRILTCPNCPLVSLWKIIDYLALTPSDLIPHHLSHIGLSHFASLFDIIADSLPPVTDHLVFLPLIAVISPLFVCSCFSPIISPLASCTAILVSPSISLRLMKRTREPWKML